MSLIETLAAQDCERDNSRLGCLGPNGYAEGEGRCNPCSARAELGIERSQRTCTTCSAPLEEAIAWVDDRAVGIGLDGSDHCPPPHHVPHLYYNEFTRRGKS